MQRIEWLEGIDMAFYINFYFKNLIYDEKTIMGRFEAPDNDVKCCFSCDMISGEGDIWDNNKPIDEILPLPITWLLMRLEENGKLNENEHKISY